ncbi:YraN family protein [Paenibacillus sp. FSL H7-0326]|uniref:YraN family protein n=1 Tax=Paenibacillus sp. FSL H7-0326 TaxID=1921144 RepID=UPI00096FBDC3|nr:YraN family protein [Paenibacillus sp. FSL H7-0326]OMC71036.1 YraN family protein [Paenibacillus sp. FSL H7-0326]
MKDDNNSKPAAPRKRKDSRKEKGGAGEQAAVQYLKQQGYDIMDTNWRCKSGELDIVAQKGGTTIFAEVRSRTSLDRFGTHLESVNLRKKAQVRRTAAVYIQERKLYNSPIRFDVIGVLLNPADWTEEPLHIDHIMNAF